MLKRLAKTKFGPIGVDLGSRAVKLAQFTADGSRLVDASRVDVTPGQAEVADSAAWIEALDRARDGKAFRGRDAALCLGHGDLFVQNVRVAKGDAAMIGRAAQQEAAARVPFPIAEAEIRYLEVADIRHGDTIVRELILMACHRPLLEKRLEIIERAGLNPVAVDIEPLALARSHRSQFRREQDQQARAMYVHIGHANTAVIIAEGGELLFIKNVDLGGRQFDEAVARSLRMSEADAGSLRRHNGDRRADRQDPEITRGVAQAIRPNIEKLVAELAMCVRYHSVSFRGKPLERVVLGGGEATDALGEAFQSRLGLDCVLSDPFRMYDRAGHLHRRGQWDVAAGLALRQAL